MIYVNGPMDSSWSDKTRLGVWMYGDGDALNIAMKYNISMNKLIYVSEKFCRVFSLRCWYF